MIINKKDIILFICGAAFVIGILNIKSFMDITKETNILIGRTEAMTNVCSILREKVTPPADTVVILPPRESRRS